MTASIWAELVAEAERDRSPKAVWVLKSTDLGDALARLIEARLGSHELQGVFEKIVRETVRAGTSLLQAAEHDLLAIRQSDPAAPSLLSIFCDYKGFIALQTWRVTSWLWGQNRCSTALLLHDAASRRLQISIHPSATIGRAVFLDHATGIVIGPLTAIGNDVTILQGVTIGRRYEQAQRAPRIGNGVYIGADAVILGNVYVGDRAKIGAGTLIEVDVPADRTIVGNPARLTNIPSASNELAAG